MQQKIATNKMTLSHLKSALLFQNGKDRKDINVLNDELTTSEGSKDKSSSSFFALSKTPTLDGSCASELTIMLTPFFAESSNIFL